MEKEKYIAYVGTYTHGSSIGIHLYDVDVAEHLDVLRYDVGDRIVLEYAEGVESCPVSDVK